MIFSLENIVIVAILSWYIYIYTYIYRWYLIFSCQPWIERSFVSHQRLAHSWIFKSWFIHEYLTCSWQTTPLTTSDDVVNHVTRSALRLRLAQFKQEVWPPGTVDTVCPRPPLITHVQRSVSRIKKRQKWDVPCRRCEVMTVIFDLGDHGACHQCGPSSSIVSEINGPGHPGLSQSDLETGVRVASEVVNLPSKFGHTRPFGSRIFFATYATDGQKQRLLPLPYRGGGITNKKLHKPRYYTLYRLEMLRMKNRQELANATLCAQTSSLAHANSVFPNPISSY